MFVNITDSAVANNKGSSRELVNYLEKENRIYQKESPELWFNNAATDVEPYMVRHAIDGNIAKLCNKDAKFFLVNISPSQKEIRCLQERFGVDGAKEQLKAHAVKVMDEYAKNFNRKGINGASDLLWFGKLEHHRYYGHKDQEVRDGLKKRGEVKDGEQMHIQVVVSRKDLTNKIKLSPMNNSRGRNVEHSQKVGQFNRVAFKLSGERVFDEVFGFDRKLGETMAYANVRANGEVEQKVAFDELKEKLGYGREFKNEKGNLSRMTGELMLGLGTTVKDIVSALMKSEYEQDQVHHPFEKKRKRNKDQNLGLER